MDEVKRLRDDLLSNRSPAALGRDAERDIVARGDKPIELRLIDPSAWDQFVDHDVTIPPLTRAARPGGFTTEEIHALEQAVQEYHGIKPPYHISMSVIMQQTGRPWQWIPEAGEFLTGFTLGKTASPRS
jgi:hypothetical protein